MLLTAFLKGLAQGSGIAAGILLTFSALSVGLAFVIPVAYRWFVRSL